MEGSLAEAQAEIAKLNNELSSEKKNFEARLEVEVERSSNLQKNTEGPLGKMLKLRQSMPTAAEAGVQLGWSKH